MFNPQQADLDLENDEKEYENIQQEIERVVNS